MQNVAFTFVLMDNSFLLVLLVMVEVVVMVLLLSLFQWLMA